MRLPLYVRILGWFFLNLAVLAAGVWLALRPGRTGEWFIMQQADPRLQAVARLLVQELHPRPQEEWDAILQKYDEAHDMHFAIFGPGARQMAGATLTIPEPVQRHLQVRQPQPGGPPLPGGPGGPPLGDGARPRPAQGTPQPMPPRMDAPFAKILERTTSPDAWWFIIRIPLRPAGPGPGGLSLVLRTESLAAGGLLVDFTPWLWGGAGLLLVSALLWIPFVRRITRHVAHMQQATVRIAQGNFDAGAPAERRDELGALAAGINALAARLAGFVTGQKRFLGDIAHELCAPLARIQMAGAALAQRAPQDLQPRIADLNEEVEAMSQLVSELLDFSRAGLAPQSIALTDTPLLPLMEQLLVRESIPAEQLTLTIPADLRARIHPGLLTRAAGNVLRNSLRYAGPGAHLEITAARHGAEILLTIADNGPGVPESTLPHLFDPFYRLDSARDRATGGTGLGLAIVRTCIESCHGTVTAQNRPAGGLGIVIRIPACGSD